MQFINKVKNKILGDDEKKDDDDDDNLYQFKKLHFEETKFAKNFIVPDENEPILSICPKGDASIGNHFKNIISLVGPPGVGKSTLSSTFYNVMRNTKYEYFEIASNTMLSFTKGIWSLNERNKILQANKDKIDVLDLEGIDDEDVIHYLVVAAMALSKAMLLCASYRDNPRFQFSMMKILSSGFNLFKQYNIQVPKPIIYIQVPYNEQTKSPCNEFHVARGKPKCDKYGLIEFIKNKYPSMKEFEMRTFSLPAFKNNNRFTGDYCKEVNNLINELSIINEQVPVFERMKYVRTVIMALNSTSPQMVSDMNFKFFKQEIKTKSNVIKSKEIELIQSKSGSIIIDENINLNQFIEKISPNTNGKWNYNDKVIEIATQLPYFNKDDARHIKIINDLKEDETLYVNIELYCKNDYEIGINDLKKKFQAKGDALMKLDDEEFTSFISNCMLEEINKISFQGSTYMPHGLNHKIIEKKAQLKRKLIENTKDLAKIPNDYLDYDINRRWENEVSKLKNRWQTMVNEAKSQKRVVTTYGDPKCPSCSTNHTMDGIKHTSCGKNSRWLWVDTKTNYCVCDSCDTLQTITGVSCSNCSTSLKLSIVTI